MNGRARLSLTWRVVPYVRLPVVLLASLIMLPACGSVPPVPLFDASINPDPASTGLVFYGDIIQEDMRAGNISIRPIDEARLEFSRRAVVVLPAGEYEFETARDTGQMVERHMRSADGTAYTLVVPVRIQSMFTITVEPGRCYRVFQVGKIDDERFSYEEYWPADRTDINPYCPESRR